MFHRKKANKIQNTKYERKIKTNNSTLNWSNSSRRLYWNGNATLCWSRVARY